MKAWFLLLRLIDNASSIWEGFLIFCMYGSGGLIAGFSVGVAWAIKEISDDWYFPLVPKFKDSLK
jgi:hypothetical protein